MPDYQLLPSNEEDELHKSRLLNVEERPYKRITKRLLLTPDSLLSAPTSLPFPNAESNEKFHEEREQQLAERRQFREDIILDFAAFENSIARIQFLHKSNERDRDRYASEKERIIKASQDVRDDTAQLRVQLDQAKQTLEQRKKFDELAEKITNNRLLRPREDQEINLRKLEEECRELEKESETYAETWKERREQFGRIVEEGMQLRRLIRDEKEEVERREGMGGGEEDGEVGGGATPSHQSVATPRPDDGSTPMPQSNSPPPETDKQEGLKPNMSFSRGGSRSDSRAPSPAVSERPKAEPEEGEDVEMTEVADDNPKVTIEDVGENEDKMDTT